MFLPQVVKSARVMKKSVAYLLNRTWRKRSAANGGDGKRQAAGKILLATVKGDVHDIGKNIVGVVLACNNYEIIDLGVMVPAAKILDVAKRENVDIVGLSGLITPSLDEMVHVAAEMEREGFDVPLLIGGATTSRVHTAVKIHPSYNRGQTVYVTDASRAVGVVSSLLSRETRDTTIANIRAEYKKVSDAHARSELDKQRLPLAKARANPFKIDWSGYQPKKPSFTGVRVYSSYEVADLVPYIDWTPFLQTYEFKGRYPAIFEDPNQGAAAKALFDDAQEMLKQIVDERWFNPKAIIGFWPANSVGDDIALFTGESRSDKLATFFGLRQPIVEAGRARQHLPVRLRGAGRDGDRRLRRRLRGHGGPGGGAHRRALRAGQRRLPLDPGQGARRPHRRGARRAHARAGAQGILGLRRRRDLRAGGPRARGIRRHPSGPRLPVPARPPRRSRCSTCSRPSPASA